MIILIIIIYFTNFTFIGDEFENIKNNIMIDQQEQFLKSIEAKYDKKYVRMQTFLLSVLTVVLAATLTIGGNYIGKITTNCVDTKDNGEDIEFIMENSVSQKAIDNLIITFENQTRVMEEYLPSDVAGAVKEFNKVSSAFRSYIIMYQNGLSSRSGGGSPQGGAE